MRQRALYRRFTGKLHIGPGGMRCRCCRIGSKSYMKRTLARIYRRGFRQSNIGKRRITQ